MFTILHSENRVCPRMTTMGGGRRGGKEEKEKKKLKIKRLYLMGKPTLPQVLHIHFQEAHTTQFNNLFVHAPVFKENLGR